MRDGVEVASRVSWRIISTAPLSGEDNMRYDRETLTQVEKEDLPPTLRFFRWSEPTVSYGRLQKVEHARRVAPAGCKVVERPTAGGLVFHDQDLCFSLAWSHAQSSLPMKPKDQYAWIHTVVRDALEEILPLRLASCCDAKSSEQPHATRECFTTPVGFDLLSEKGKVVGGALARRRTASLYQGSIQGITAPDLESRLRNAFHKAFAAS